MPHRQNKVEDSVLKIYSTDPETLSRALILVTGVPPKAVIGPDPHLSLVEKSSVGGRPNKEVEEGAIRAEASHIPPYYSLHSKCSPLTNHII